MGVQPLVEVSLRVTVPAAVSAALGMYVPFSVVLFGENVPLPLVLHTPVPVLEVPFSVTFALLAQTVWLLPALTVGVCWYVIVTVSETDKQDPLLVEVNISVTVPADVSAVLGI